MGPMFWMPQSPDRLLKCSERQTNSCDLTETDGCCSVIPCVLCLQFYVAPSTYYYGEAPFSESAWSGTIAGVSFQAYWERDYQTDECEFVVAVNGIVVYRKSCYEGASCRHPDGSTTVTIGEDEGTLTWSVFESRPLEYIQDPDNGCRTYFCDDCDCSCDCLCVTITETDTTTHLGEICDTAYGCDAPLWEGTVGGYDLSMSMGRDEYGRCIITPTVDGVEQDSVLFPGCADATTTVTLLDGTTIALTCKRCSCDETASTRCCDRTDIADTLYLTVTDLVNCTCNDWLAVIIELKQSNAQQNAGLLRWAGCTTGPCTTINGVPTTQTVYFLLECTEGQIGQTGVPTDFLLTVASTRNSSNVDVCVDSPYEDNGISIAGVMPSVQLELSSCLPLVLVWRVVAGESVASVFEALCQDPMAPPGPVEWELTVTE